MVAVTLSDSFRRTFADGNGFDMEYASAPVGNHQRVIICTAFTPVLGTDDTFADLAATEVAAATGYVTEGSALSNGTITKDGGGEWEIDFDDPTAWAQDASGFTNGRRFVFLWDNGGVMSTWPVIGWSADFGADLSNVGGPVSIELDAEGLIGIPR